MFITQHDSIKIKFYKYLATSTRRSFIRQGKGYMHTYFVLGEDRQQRLRRLTQTNTKVLEEMCQSDTEKGPNRKMWSQSEELRYMPDSLGTNRACSLVDDVFLLSNTAEDCDNEHVKLLPYQESATYCSSLEN